MISGGALLSLLITLVIVGMILWLCWWFIGYIGLPNRSTRWLGCSWPWWP